MFPKCHVSSQSYIGGKKKRKKNKHLFYISFKKQLVFKVVRQFKKWNKNAVPSFLLLSSLTSSFKAFNFSYMVLIFLSSARMSNVGDIKSCAIVAHIHSNKTITSIFIAALCGYYRLSEITFL